MTKILKQFQNVESLLILEIALIKNDPFFIIYPQRLSVITITRAFVSLDQNAAIGTLGGSYAQCSTSVKIRNPAERCIYKGGKFDIKIYASCSGFITTNTISLRLNLILSYLI